jgi:hypothetical protein
MDFKKMLNDVTSVLMEARDKMVNRLSSPPPPTKEQIHQKIADQVSGTELTLSYCCKLFGAQQGDAFWKQLGDIKKRFHDKFPDDDFPPIFISGSAKYGGKNASYTSNAILKEDRNGKIDTTDTYEAIYIGTEFFKEKTPNEILATICHELAHDGKNHTNQNIDYLNMDKSMLPQMQKVQECEADMIATQLQAEKQSLASLLIKITKESKNYNYAEPHDFHPSGKQRVGMIQQPNIMMADPHRTHLNDRCEIIDRPITPSNPIEEKNKGRA